MDIKGFLLRFFAAVGLIIPFIFGIVLWSLWHSDLLPRQRPEALPDKIVLDLDLTNPLVEQAQGFAFSIPNLLEQGDNQSFLPLVIALKKAKEDPRVKGVIAKLGPYVPSLVHAQELATAINNFRKSGKTTSIFAPSYGSFGPGGTSYYLASQFEEIWLQPVGSVALTGLCIEAPFAKSVFEKWGIKADFFQREEYKSVMENVTRDSFSEPVRKNMESMIGSLASQMASGIALGRRIETDKARLLMSEGPYTAQEALKAGLVTKIGYEDELLKELEKKHGDDTERIDAGTYLFRADAEDKEKSKAQVALIYAEGLITDIPPEGPYRAAEDEMIDTASVVEAFRTASEDEEIKAILFRVNSPGGSPVASETIRRAVVLAKESKKPVFVSMGRVAASGGYWIAMDATRILADPATITGSIGVVAGKFVLGGLFDKLGVKWDGLDTSENANLWSMRESFTDKQRVRMNAMIDETYGAFLKNVSTARKIPLEKMPDIAKGRVFTGEQALQAGLIDELGGMETAISAIKNELKLAEKDKISLIPLPPPETPQSMAIQMIREFMSGSAMAGGFWNRLPEIKSLILLMRDSLSDQSAVSARIPPSFVSY